ncbi:MAG: BMP family ABC transporter substrate-binding protein [Bdellovibrionota bacterium]
MLFNEHEGSFLVGAIAALTTKSNVVGFIGGMDIPLIRRFEVGYRAGVQHINPKVEVITNYVGSTSDAWKNPMKGKEPRPFPVQEEGGHSLPRPVRALWAPSMPRKN